MFDIIYEIISKNCFLLCHITHFMSICLHLIVAVGVKCWDLHDVLTRLHNLMCLFSHHVFESITVRVRFTTLLRAEDSAMWCIIYISVV